MRQKYFSFAKALRHASDGLSHAFKTQANFRIQLVLAWLVIILSLILNLNILDFSIILFAIILVLSAEMINTAFETFTNLVGASWRHQAKIAKDVAAGMVLVVSVGAALVGLIVFTPYLKTFF